jgi:hypothetical protein
VIENTENLLEREQVWMDTKDSHNPEKGYNILKQAGRPVGFRHSEETKEKMRQSHIGIKMKDSAKELLIERLKGNDYCRGKPKSDATKDKMRKAAYLKKSNGFKGVEKCRGRWRARAGGTHLGMYDTAEEAALAYDKHVSGLYGTECQLNFPNPRTK